MRDLVTVFALLASNLAQSFAQVSGDPFVVASGLFERGHWEAAEAAFRKLVAEQPTRAEAWKGLGVVYAARQDYESAEEPFRRACTLQPGFRDACLYHARDLYLLNRFQPAVAVIRKALPGDPKNTQLHRILALCLEALGDIPEAGKEFEAAIRLTRPSSPPAEDPRIDYGVYLFRLGSAEEALVPLNAAMEQNPNVARTHLELGAILLALDRVTEAAYRLEHAAKLDPGPARAHLLLTKAYQRLGRQAEAEVQLRQGSETVK